MKITHAHTYVYFYFYPWSPTGICEYLQSDTNDHYSHVYIDTSTHAHIMTDTHTHTHTHTHTLIVTHTHTHTHTMIVTHTHTHTHQGWTDTQPYPTTHRAPTRSPHTNASRRTPSSSRRTAIQTTNSFDRASVCLILNVTYICIWIWIFVILLGIDFEKCWSIHSPKVEWMSS